MWWTPTAIADLMLLEDTAIGDNTNGACEINQCHRTCLTCANINTAALEELDAGTHCTSACNVMGPVAQCTSCRLGWYLD